MKLISSLLSKKQLSELRKLPFVIRNKLIQDKLTERMILRNKLKQQQMK